MADCTLLVFAVTNMRSENWGVVAGLAGLGYVAGYYFGEALAC